MRCCCWCPCSFKRYIDQVFAEHMDILSATVARAAAGNTQLDLHDLMYRFTLDSFGKIGFGVQLGCLSSSEAKVPFAAAFDQAQVVSDCCCCLTGCAALAHYYVPGLLDVLQDSSHVAINKDSMAA
jgi:hypothetical protein